jgi:hypothetical protein
MDDSKLDVQLPCFDGGKASRASIMMDAAHDSADHYNKFAFYLCLSGLLPPTAQTETQ